VWTQSDAVPGWLCTHDDDDDDDDDDLQDLMAIFDHGWFHPTHSQSHDETMSHVTYYV